MRYAELPVLKERILDVARQSRVFGHVRDVLVEADNTDNSGEVLRVDVSFDSLKGLHDSDLYMLIMAIEGVVEGIDERFPSVRFAEAA